MAGLLAQGWDDPRSAAMMALAGQMVKGDFGGGLLASQNAYTGTQDAALKRGLLQAQMQETIAQAEQRQIAATKAKQQQDLINSLLGPQGANASQVPPGAFQPSPSQAGPMGPTMPPSMAGQAAPGSRLANLGFDQLLALKMSGLDLTDLHKYANDPLKMEQGATYRDRVTGQERYMPKVGEGIAPGAGGFYAPLPGYAGSIAEIEGAKTRATEGAKAGLDLVKAIGPDGAERWVTRSQAVQATQPAPMARPEMPAQGGMRGNFIGNPEQVMAAIQGIADPQERANAIAAFEEQARRTQGFAQGGAFQASPTNAQAADAAGLKARAEADAKAAAERQAGRVKKGDQANDMITNIGRARTLLTAGNGPTESLIGTGVDKALGVFGGSTPGGNAANSLKTLAGWLTSNVPRMEGPQSNTDLANYSIMAGQVGDSTLPVSQRLASLNEVERIQQKYAHLNGGQNQTQTQVLDTLPTNAPKGQRVRDTETGQVLEFNGMSWVKVK